MSATKVTAALFVSGLACVGLALGGCRGLRASQVPLGGKHVEEVASAKPAPAGSAEAALPAAKEEPAKAESKPPVEPVASAAPASSSAPAVAAPPGAFTVKPYFAHQAWTRVFDLEF